ncbi:PIN domain-containing protein [Demequina sp.]|uniref:PIN domain-containing protein n=1 Tax=Demequina sp. TaxID=2050685 RepID=UPI003D0D30C4
MTSAAVPSLDASVLLRWLLNDVPDQSAAVERLLNGGDPLYVADVALTEVGFVLERSLGLSRGLVADCLTAVLALGQVVIDRTIWGQAIDAYRSHAKLSLADAYLASNAITNDAAPLLTFDKKLAQQLDGTQLLEA